MAIAAREEEGENTWEEGLCRHKTSEEGGVGGAVVKQWRGDLVGLETLWGTDAKEA